MAVQFVDAVAGKTTTTGAGTYTITANVAGFRDFAQIADGVLVECVIRSATDLEIGLYTKGGGAAPTLARTTIHRNLAGTTSAVSWAAGEKDVRTTISREILPALIANNVWLADQYMRTARLAFGGNDASYFYSDIDNNIVGVLNNLEFMRILDGSPPSMRLRWTDPGTGSGPTFRLDRNSSTPAINDRLAQILFDGRHSGGGIQTYGKIQCYTTNVTSGSENGGIDVIIPVAGVDAAILRVSSNDVIAMPGINDVTRVFMVGKTTQGANNQGVELVSTGLITATTDNSTCMYLNRKNGDGQIVSIRRDNAEQASIAITAGVVSYGTFCANHSSQVIDFDDILEVGTVLSSVDEQFEPDNRWHLPKVKITATQSCKRVLGVYGGTCNGEVLVNAIGAFFVKTIGLCHGGDLLCSSAIPGVAEVQPDDLVHSYTIGKVTMGDDRTDTRLVAVTLCCG